MPPPVHSVLILSVLSHTHALWLTAPLLLFLSLGGLLEPLFALDSVQHHRKQNPCSSLACLPHCVVTLAAAQLLQVSFFIFFLFLLSFFPGTPAIQTMGPVHKSSTYNHVPGHWWVFTWNGYFGVLRYVLQGPPIFKCNPKSWGGLCMFLAGSDSLTHTSASISHLKALCKILNAIVVLLINSNRSRNMYLSQKNLKVLQSLSKKWHS